MKTKLIYFTTFVVLYLCLMEFLFGKTCPFQILFGIPCPGCGMSRAFWSLIHFHFRESFSYHPLLCITPIFLLLIVRIAGRKDRISERILFSGFIVLFIAVYLYRIIHHDKILSFGIENSFFIGF